MRAENRTVHIFIGSSRSGQRDESCINADASILRSRCDSFHHSPLLETANFDNRRFANGDAAHVRLVYLQYGLKIRELIYGCYLITKLNMLSGSNVYSLNDAVTRRFDISSCDAGFGSPQRIRELLDLSSSSRNLF